LSAPSVKGTLLLATVRFLQVEAVPANAESVRSLVHQASGEDIILASRWYPRSLLHDLEKIASRGRRAGVPFTRRALGAFYAEHLLKSTYANLRKDSPQAMAPLLPLLYDRIFTDLKMRVQMEGPEEATFAVEGPGLSLEDQETHAGIIEGALTQAGAARTTVVPIPSSSHEGVTFGVSWGTASPSPAEKVPVRGEFDIMSARDRARKVAHGMGFGIVDVVCITTCASELARNIFNYAGEGTLAIEDTTQNGGRCIRIVASDQGPGIADLERVLAGNHKSERGMGMGLCAIRRLADEFNVETAPDRGTSVEVVKYLRRS